MTLSASTSGRAPQVSSAQIRAAMFGVTVDGLQVVRQASWVGPDDTAELALLCVRSRAWWVACRRGARLSVWAFAGDDEAVAGFERELAGAGWHEASPVVLAG